MEEEVILVPTIDINDVSPPVIVDESQPDDPDFLSPTMMKKKKKHQRSSSTSRIDEYAKDVVPLTKPARRPSITPKNYNKQKNGWNDYLAVYVKRLGQRAGGYKWMHSQSTVYYNRCYQWVGICCIIVSAVATAGDIPYVTTCQSDLNWIKIVAIVLGVAVTVALTFQQFKSFGSRSADHSHCEANWAAFYDQIKLQLHKNSKDRQEANDYIDWIAKEFISLKEASPVIPEWIWKKYRLKIAGKNIADPEGIDEIVIKKDSPTRSERLDDDTESFEVVVDKPPVEPRFGFLSQAEEDMHSLVPSTRSEQDKIAMERWNDQ
jgi:hypothetical protein